MKIYCIVQRTLSFPFFFGIAFVGASIMFAKWIINFIRFGGESIAYTDKMNRKTIQDVFVKLNEMQKTE
jgi:predicted membrane protein